MTQRTQSPATAAAPKPLSEGTEDATEPLELRPGLRDLPWLGRYCMRAMFELVRARLQFARLTARHIVTRNERSQQEARANTTCAQRDLARMAYVLPRISNRLPWRSDCLVQAMAAQNWLGRRGMASEIRIGVDHPANGPFEAHAWLVCDGTAVTGGNISRYHPLFGKAGVSAGPG